VKAVVLISGGLDSTTLLYYVISQKYEPYVLSFDYGQRHKKELECAKNICKELNVPHEIVDVSSINKLIAKGSLAGKEIVPKGHYAEEIMKQTVVPNRNMIMLSIAVGYAATVGAETVFYGPHKGDSTIYPDCRKEFVKAIDTAVYLGNLWENDGRSVTIIAPFIDMSKSDIVALGLKLQVPFEKTWSCYEGKERPCSKELCGTCFERVESFLDNNVKDPLLTDEEWKAATEYVNKRKSYLNNK
jgi:7-cyano-7-deazaguanine synthase